MKLNLRGKSKKTSAPRKVAERKTEKEKVEERREEVLARGRKFKYPLQYAKHRLVVNTIVIGELQQAAERKHGFDPVICYHITHLIRIMPA